MAFGLFRKRLPEPAAPTVEPQAVRPGVTADASLASDSDSATEILELLEVELGAMIRQLERAANSVAGGAEATAATLATIRGVSSAANLESPALLLVGDVVALHSTLAWFGTAEGIDLSRTA